MSDKQQFKPVDKLKKDGEYSEVKIRCRYCDLKDTCHLRETKETYEEAGWTTRCPFTPNRPKKKSRSKKK